MVKILIFDRLLVNSCIKIKFFFVKYFCGIIELYNNVFKEMCFF